MRSERTNQCFIAKVIFTILHFLALFGPFLYFIPYCFATSGVGTQIGIGFAMVVAIILCVIALLIDQKHRQGLHKSSFWVLTAAVAYALESVTPFVFLMAGVSLIDELLFVRLKDHYSTALLANKEIDRRN